MLRRVKKDVENEIGPKTEIEIRESNTRTTDKPINIFLFLIINIFLF